VEAGIDVFARALFHAMTVDASGENGDTSTVSGDDVSAVDRM
jgi:hypothetical protein